MDGIITCGDADVTDAASGGKAGNGHVNFVGFPQCQKRDYDSDFGVCFWLIHRPKPKNFGTGEFPHVEVIGLQEAFGLKVHTPIMSHRKSHPFVTASYGISTGVI